MGRRACGPGRRACRPAGTDGAARDEPATIVATSVLRAGRPEARALLGALAAAWVHGADLDWAGIFAGPARGAWCCRPTRSSASATGSSPPPARTRASLGTPARIRSRPSSGLRWSTGTLARWRARLGLTPSSDLLWTLCCRRSRPGGGAAWSARSSMAGATGCDGRRWAMPSGRSLEVHGWLWSRPELWSSGLSGMWHGRWSGRARERSRLSSIWPLLSGATWRGACVGRWSTRRPRTSRPVARWWWMEFSPCWRLTKVAIRNMNAFPEGSPGRWRWRRRWATPASRGACGWPRAEPCRWAPRIGWSALPGGWCGAWVESWVSSSRSAGAALSICPMGPRGWTSERPNGCAGC